MTEAQATMEEVGPRLKFEDNAIQLDVDWIEQDWIPTWKRVKTTFQKGIKQMTIETYQSKDESSSPAENVIYHVKIGTDGGNEILKSGPRTN